VLCTEYATPCPEGEDYEPGTKLDATLEPETSMRFSSGGTLVNTCTASTIEGKTSTTGSATETVSAVLTALTFGGCNKKIAVLENGELEIHYIDEAGNATKGTLTLKGSSMTIEVFGGVSCVYGTGVAAHIGTFTSDDSMTYATIDFKTTLIRQGGGFLCPANVVAEALYNVTQPKPLYVKKQMAA
jgi:hypothetical protein